MDIWKPVQMRNGDTSIADMVSYMHVYVKPYQTENLITLISWRNRYEKACDLILFNMTSVSWVLNSVELREL